MMKRNDSVTEYSQDDFQQMMSSGRSDTIMMAVNERSDTLMTRGGPSERSDSIMQRMNETQDRSDTIMERGRANTQTTFMANEEQEEVE